MLRNIFLITLLIYSYSAHADEAASAVVQPEKTPVELEKLDGFLVCFACKSIVQWVKKQVSDQPTLEQIKQILHSACEKLTIGQAVCHYIVNNFSDVIAELILEHADPPIICKKIHLCK